MIESLHSPHVGRVKALIGSRGVKERNGSRLFVAEGIQALREALTCQQGPAIETLYLSPAGAQRISDLDVTEVNVVEVNDAVMQAMTSTVTPQGILMVCSIPNFKLSEIAITPVPGQLSLRRRALICIHLRLSVLLQALSGTFRYLNRSSWQRSLKN